MQVFLLLALVFAIIIAVFAVQNTDPVTVRFIGWEVQGLSLAIVVLVSAAVGAFLTFFVGLSRLIRGSLGARADRKRIADQQKALDDLEQRNARLQDNVGQLQRENAQLRARLSEPAASAPVMPQGTVVEQRPVEPPVMPSDPTVGLADQK